MKYNYEQRKQLVDNLKNEIAASRLSNNKFAVERLGFSGGSKLSHILNNFDKAGMVSDETFGIVERYLQKVHGYKIVATKNFIKVWDVCERAHNHKKSIVISGDAGTGKTLALTKFKEKIESEDLYKVYYFDASMVSTKKQFILQFMTMLNCFKSGTIERQVGLIREAVSKQDCLIIIDEASAFHGKNVTVIKDVMTAIWDVCGMVLAGTPYFIENINRGASRNKHLYSETKDRLFMITETLSAPTDKEAKAIFKANGIDGEALEIALGNVPGMLKYSYKVKPTYRGIADFIATHKIVTEKPKKTLEPLSII